MASEIAGKDIGRQWERGFIKQHQELSKAKAA
jgi:hypothetical protein